MGSSTQEIREGDVVWIPPGQQHWHEATATTGMTHIAIQEHLDGKVVQWMEKVSDAQYGTPVRAHDSSVGPARSAVVSVQRTPAQRLIGDFSPKLVELTDKVLFGDVWARPQLSQRDRSLVTVNALIARTVPTSSNVTSPEPVKTV